jgi:hypothetical protein
MNSTTSIGMRVCNAIYNSRLAAASDSLLYLLYEWYKKEIMETYDDETSALVHGAPQKEEVSKEEEAP